MPLVKSRVMVLSVVLGVLLGLFIVVSLPSNTAYSIASEGPNGLSDLYAKLDVRVLYSLSELSNLNSESILLICARAEPPGGVKQLLDFVEGGGVVVAYGSPEYLVEVLEELGTHASFRGYVRDAVFNAGDLDSVLVNTTYGNAVFRKPYALDVDFSSSSVSVIAWSSLFSYVDVSGNNLYDLNEPIGSFPLGVEVTLEKGKILVLFSKILVLFTEYLLENSVLTHNLDFIKVLAGNKTVVVDQSEMRSHLVEILRAQLVQRSSPSIYVVLPLLALLSVVAYLAVKK
ncbi:MAG: hypothetical protein QXZ48_08495 [Zestosphaera sp.]